MSSLGILTKSEDFLTKLSDLIHVVKEILFVEALLICFIPGSFKEAFYGLNIELHTLILNAGVMALPQRRDGAEDEDFPLVGPPCSKTRSVGEHSYKNYGTYGRYNMV